MSLERPQQPPESDANPAVLADDVSGPLDADALRRALGDAALATEEHVRAPVVQIRPDVAQSSLSALRDNLGFDHLSCVTVQEYEDCYESVYYLKSCDDPTREASVVVPMSRSDLVSESTAPVSRVVEWHEREVYGLIGIQYENHSDLRRILLPETWQGHPLGLDYDRTRPQVVRYDENANPLVGDGRADMNMVLLSIGSHHPMTHGVMHPQVTLNDEQVADVEPDIGCIHRCKEQMRQQGTYRHQTTPYPDRWDWDDGGLLNEWAYARTVKALADIDVPEYAQVLRVLAAELSRTLSYTLAVGAYALGVVGDFTTTFMYTMRDREPVQNILEDLTGQQLMFNYFWLGGVVWDLPKLCEELLEKIRMFVNGLPEKPREYHDLLTVNEILQARTVGTGILLPEVAKDYGVTGPVARGSGIDYDPRRDDPCGYYDELDRSVAVEDGCDNLARLLVRFRRVEESATIVAQCVDLSEDQPDDDRTIQVNVPRTLKPDDDTEAYRVVEAVKGELGIYIRADGIDTPVRLKIRGPSFSNLQSLPEMTEGEYIPDLIAALGSLDTIMGEVDR